ncbi:hypothetical protein EDC01DRAFT_783390 [Geopyxis carbonaria]|nr:hypothetical protein EDC01DRAFT_783390 [Geopyxis carbonaria]
MSLGLGSRSGPPRRTHTPMKPASTALVPASASRATPSARRGFGLFDDSDDEEMEQLSPAQPVKFSGDTSGFEGLRKAEPTAIVATPKSGSRNRRTAPAKTASSRATPYSTTSRALMRAKGQKETEDPILGESIFKGSPEYKETKAEESGTDEEVTRKTPSKRLFQTEPPSAKTPTPRKEHAGEKTWGEWIGNFVPESIKKPVSKVLASTPLPKKSKKDIFLTPEADVNALTMPGSFEKPEQKTLKFINPNFVAMDKHQTTPIPNPNLFTYNHSFSAASPSRESKLPLRSSTMSALTSSTRQATPSGTFRKPSNFISRMKSTPGKKASSRFTPYGRSATPRKSPAKELTPEEELKLLEQRERDRKVQEREDKYKRRETLRKLGKDVESDEDDAMVDSSPVKTPSKGKGRAVTMEDDMDIGEPQASTTPPSTPPKSVSKVTPKASPFAAPPRGPTLFAPTPPSAPPSSPPKEWSTDSDKENTGAPPPPPTMSHRQLPSSAATPPPVPETSGLGLPHPLGGHGIAPPVALEPPGIRQRNLLNKHKPRVSSSLRESSTYAKENDDDTKENPVASSSSSTSGMFKSSGLKTFGASTSNAQSTVPARTAGALREASANAPAATVKVDIAAKVAQLPVGDLFNVLLFPSATPIGSGDSTVKSAVERYWAPKEEWGGAIFEGLRAESVMV